MKSLATTLLFSGLLCGQATPPVAPGTPAPPVQAPPPETPPPAPVTPDTVVAEVGGKKLTAAEVDKLFAGLPPQMQQSARMQPEKAVTTVLMLRYMAEEAVKANLD